MMPDKLTITISGIQTAMKTKKKYTRIDPQKLFSYSDRFAARHETKGEGTVYPTVRQAAKRFRCSYDDIQDAVDSFDGEGYLGIAVAIGIPGSGYDKITPDGDRPIEAYHD